MIRFAHAVYCDDIRQEIGNKESLIGIYHGKMFVSSFPILIPKLCITFWARTPIDRPFKKVTIRVLFGDKVALESPWPDNFLQPGEPPPPNDNVEVLTLHQSIALSPLPIEGPVTIKLRIQTEEEELKAGGLSIELAAQSNETLQLPPVEPKAGAKTP